MAVSAIQFSKHKHKYAHTPTHNVRFNYIGFIHIKWEPKSNKRIRTAGIPPVATKSPPIDGWGDTSEMWKYIFRCANFAVAVLPLTMKLNKLLVLAGNVGRALIKTFNTTAQHKADEFPFHPKKPKRHCLFVRMLRNHHYLCKLFGKWDDGFMSDCMQIVYAVCISFSMRIEDQTQLW